MAFKRFANFSDEVTEGWRSVRAEKRSFWTVNI